MIDLGNPQNSVILCDRVRNIDIVVKLFKEIFL